MNKTIDITKNAMILFVVNIIILIGTVFFKFLYTNQGYQPVLVNVIFVINLIILILGIVFNVLFVKNKEKYDNKKSIILVIVVFILFLLLNSVFIIVVNKIYSSGYTKINSTLSSYCDTFGCDKYETVTEDGYEKFIIEKVYFDYDNIENDLKITATYNTEKVIEVEAEIYSRNEMFSETLIKETLKNYFSNFGYEIDESLITEAFEKRFTSSVEKDNATYRVTEIYNKNSLEKLKTTITLNLNQG